MATTWPLKPRSRANAHEHAPRNNVLTPPQAADRVRPLTVCDSYTETKTCYIDFSGGLQRAQIDNYDD